MQCIMTGNDIIYHNYSEWQLGLKKHSTFKIIPSQMLEPMFTLIEHFNLQFDASNNKFYY